MKRLATILFLLLALAILQAQTTNNLWSNVGNYGIAPQVGINVTFQMQPYPPYYTLPRIYNGSFVRNDPIGVHTDTNGNFYLPYTLIWGKYSMNISGQQGTGFTIYIGTNTTGVVNLVTCTSNSATMPFGQSGYSPGTNVTFRASGSTTFIDVASSGSSATNLMWGQTTNQTGSARQAYIYFFFPTNAYTISNYPCGILTTN